MLAVVAACVVVAAEPAETRVRTRRPQDIDDVRIDDDTPSGLGPDALLSVPGVSLVREGGPLAPVRPVVRGLSGARLDVTVLGLPFVDPAEGFVDAALWPWALGTVDVDVGAASAGVANLGGLGGSIVVRRPPAGTRLSLLAGELDTLQVSGRAVTALDDDDVDAHVSGVAGVAFGGGFTAGDFVFRPEDAGGAPGAATLRQNNDQRRASLTAFADVGVSGSADLRLRGGVVAGAHDGGVAGFATQPLLTLRGRRALTSAGLGLSYSGPVVVDVDGFASGGVRATADDGRFDDDSASVLWSRRAGARVAVKSDLVARAGLHVAGAAVVDAAAADIPDVVRRQEAGARVSATVKADVVEVFDADVVAFADVDAGARIVDDVGAFLPTGSLRVGLTRAGLSSFVGVVHAARAPTLDERFAPRGFVQGNRFLAPERATDVELGVVVDGDIVDVRAVGFASRLEDAITYVNRSAFAVVPVNTGVAGRTGLDLGGAVRPVEGLELDVTASLLSSMLQATRAPLPQAPPFLLRTAARVGDETGGVDVIVTARGPSTSNLFGTQVAPGFALVDLVGRWPLSHTTWLKATLQNVLDVQNARDTNLLPLPGRLFFFGLEVKS